MLFRSIGLPTLAQRYIEWYNRNVKPSTQTIIDVQAQFENSRIATGLVRKISGINFLKDHRLKTTPEEDLQEGEESLCVQTVEEPIAVVEDDVPQYAPVREGTEAFIKDLVRNAPTYIQSRENDNIADESKNDTEIINNFLNMLENI